MQLTKQLNNERVYSLDALRGIMMLLGIVIHASITYGTIDYGDTWGLKDAKSNHLSFDIIVMFIHAFRMPVFFVAAGYFGSLLFYKKGSMGMIRNWINRILFPLIAGVLIIYPLIAFAFTYSRAAIVGAPDAWQQATSVITSGNFLPFKTIHLWFIYYLILFSFAGWLIDNLLNRMPKVMIAVDGLFKKFILNFWLCLLCSGLLGFLCLYWMGTSFLKTNTTFEIEAAVFVTYFVFYGMGWMLYRTDSLKQFSHHCWMQLVIATLLFLVSTFTPWPEAAWTLIARQIITAVYTPLFVFGFIALFQTYFHFYSPRLNYLMDASYWVYIIHLPVVAFIPGLIGDLALPALIKFLIVFSATMLICFVSYHYLVRGSFIGMFLNGKIIKTKQIIPQIVAIE